MKKDFKIIIIFLIYYFVIVFFGLGRITSYNKKLTSDILTFEEREKIVAYNDCVKTAEIDMTNENKALNEFLSKYKTSVKYFDVNNNREFVYNENEVYYGASLIKVNDALYAYNEALKDNNYLNDTVKYLSKYQFKGSIPLKQKHKVGQMITIEDLTKYAIYYSDNASHIMLVDHIGKSNLNKFMKSLNLKYYLGSAYFTSIDVDDAFIYMKTLYDFIDNNPEYKNQLFKAFNNEFYNHLKINDVPTLHKYGYYGSAIHDIGIIYEKNPYILVVLTRHGNSKDDVIKIIAKEINKYHESYYDKLHNYCQKN